MRYLLQVFDYDDTNTDSSPDWVDWLSADLILRLEVIKEFVYTPRAKKDRRHWRILDTRSGGVVRDFPV